MPATTAARSVVAAAVKRGGNSHAAVCPRFSDYSNKGSSVEIVDYVRGAFDSFCMCYCKLCNDEGLDDDYWY
jgi:hypothetical protein